VLLVRLERILKLSSLGGEERVSQSFEMEIVV